MSIRADIREYAVLSNSVADIQAQIAVLQLEMKDMESRMEEIKKGLKEQLIESGKKRAIIEGWKLNLSQSTTTIIEEADEIPEEFWKVKREPDVMKIKERLKIGLSVPGAILRRNTNMSIKPVSTKESDEEN